MSADHIRATLLRLNEEIARADAAEDRAQAAEEALENLRFNFRRLIKAVHGTESEEDGDVDEAIEIIDEARAFRDHWENPLIDAEICDVSDLEKLDFNAFELIRALGGYTAFAVMLEREGIIPYATQRCPAEIGDLLTQ